MKLLINLAIGTLLATGNLPAPARADSDGIIGETQSNYYDSSVSSPAGVYGGLPSLSTNLGRTVIRDDGVSYTTYGNRTFDNRGNSWTTYGNTVYGSDGSSCTRYGNETLCD